jgi:Predicted transcriptional regulator containing an HTH domain and an uncharacterized domain shared with the mammalian protein Schlafen
MNKDLNMSDFREGNRIEAKLAKGGLPASIWETYSAFANTDGGLILLGVKENKDHSFEFVGVEDPDSLIKSFWDTVNNRNKVSINILTNRNVYSKEIDGKNIVFIEVPSAERQFKPVYLNNNILGGTYHRNGEGDYLCTKEDVSEMFRDASAVSMDSKILTGMDESVFCTDSVKGYRNVFSNIHLNHIWNDLDDVSFLRKIGAMGLDKETGKLHPTAAGLLMFGYEYEIVREFSLYFLDYQEKYDDANRWTDRVISSSGDWSGNVFDFFFKIASKLLSDIKKPFKLDGIFRVDDTPVHKAVREALVNTLVNADYYGRQGLVIQKYPDRFVFSNPGTFRIPLKDAFDGGTSDPRNATMLKMFSMIHIGERAGSGIPGIVATWEKVFKTKPEYEQKYSPSRIKMVLYIAEFVEKSSDNVENVQENGESNQKSDQKSNQKSDQKILELIAQNPKITIDDLMQSMSLSESGVKKILRALKAQNLIRRVGPDKGGHWEIVK